MSEKSPINDLPREALNVSHNNCGFLPTVGLYPRGDMYYQSLSRSHHWLFGIMVVAAVIIALLPWHTRALLFELKYWVAGMCLFAGLCDLLGGWLQTSFTQNVSIDVKRKTMVIVDGGFELRLAWEQIMGLQICRQKVPGNSELNGYQLNLIWREADGTVKRHCLLKHSIKRFVVGLGRRYESLFGFTVMDHSAD